MDLMLKGKEKEKERKEMKKEECDSMRWECLEYGAKWQGKAERVPLG